MDPIAFKFLGAGLACIGMGLAAMGVGNIFGNFLSRAVRNPSAADGQFARTFIGAALAEGLGIFCLVVALVLLFTYSHDGDREGEACELFASISVTAGSTADTHWF